MANPQLFELQGVNHVLTGSQSQMLVPTEVRTGNLSHINPVL